VAHHIQCFMIHHWPHSGFPIVNNLVNFFFNFSISDIPTQALDLILPYFNKLFPFPQDSCMVSYCSLHHHILHPHPLTSRWPLGLRAWPTPQPSTIISSLSHYYHSSLNYQITRLSLTSTPPSVLYPYL